MVFALLVLTIAHQKGPVTTPIDSPKKAVAIGPAQKPRHPKVQKPRSAAMPASPKAVAPLSPVAPVFKDLVAGSGHVVETGDLVTVDFIVKRKGTDLADSSRRGLAYTFRVGDAGNDPLLELVVKGMKIGGTRTGLIVAKTVYGAAGAPPLIAPGDALDVTVKLLSRSLK